MTGVMILMTDNNDDSANRILKQRLVEVSNLSGRQIISTYKSTGIFPAYSTYLGKRMTPDFDFAVHCNIMYFMLDKNYLLPPPGLCHNARNNIDGGGRAYMKAPVYVSPYCKIEHSYLSPPPG